MKEICKADCQMCDTESVAVAFDLKHSGAMFLVNVSEMEISPIADPGFRIVADAQAKTSMKSQHQQEFP